MKAMSITGKSKASLVWCGQCALVPADVHAVTQHLQRAQAHWEPGLTVG
ncbi:hypothetical protein [Mycolicibacterium stellerae]|nr:hypothetical protein [Mycolicibacterium stellerae]